MKDWLLKHPMQALIAALLVVLLIGVGWYELNGGAAGQLRREVDQVVRDRDERLESFDRMLDAGMPCFGLFEVRNAESPNDPIVEQMNVRMRDVGCFMSTSERTD